MAEKSAGEKALDKKNRERFKDLDEKSRAYLDSTNENFKSFMSDYMFLKQDSAPILTSGYRPKKEGDDFSWHHTGDAGDFRTGTIDADWLMNTKEGLGLQLRYGVALLDESNPRILAKTGGTGSHYHVGKDSEQLKLIKDRYDNFNEETSSVFLTYDMYNAEKKSQYLQGEREYYVSKPGDNSYNYLGENADYYEAKEIEDFNNSQTSNIDLTGFTGTKTKEEKTGISQDEIQQAVNEALLEQERLKDASRSKLQEESNKRKAEEQKLEAVMAMFSDEELTPAQMFNQARKGRQAEQDNLGQYQQIDVQQGLQGIQGFGMV